MNNISKKGLLLTLIVFATWSPIVMADFYSRDGQPKDVFPTDQEQRKAPQLYELTEGVQTQQRQMQQLREEQLKAAGKGQLVEDRERFQKQNNWLVTH